MPRANTSHAHTAYGPRGNTNILIGNTLCYAYPCYYYAYPCYYYAYSCYAVLRITID